MVTKDFINKDFPILDSTTTAQEALLFMKEKSLWNICTYFEGEYGIITKKHLKKHAPSEPISNCLRCFQKIYILDTAHVWEALRAFSTHTTNVLPVVNKENEYQGSVILKNIFDRIDEIFPIGSGGAILALEIGYQHYSLAEIASIIEQAGAKVNMLSVIPINSGEKVSIVISINKNDASDVIQSLERHNYQVDSWFMNKGKIDTILEERYSAFMNFINV